MRTITILCSNHCLSSSITSFIDAFEMANQLWQESERVTRPLFNWRLASPDGKEIITSTGMKMAVDGGLPSGHSNIIYVPACRIISEEQLMEEVDEVVNWSGTWLNTQYSDGALIAVGCCGAFVLAKTGLLLNKEVTAGWWLAPIFRNLFPAIKLNLDQSIVESDRIISAGPVNSHFSLALKVIEQTAGHHLASLCAKTMLIDNGRPSQVTHETIQLVMKHSDDAILKAQEWIQKNLHRSFQMKDVSDVVNMSQRTFIRRFKRATGLSPIKYIAELRIDIAKHLLETSDLSVELIIDRIGYTDASSFRKLFKKNTSLLPLQYRKESYINRYAK
jgi:transcriptional regulator GlxA family with amidase domain